MRNTSQIIKVGILSIIIFIASSYLAFYFEGEYTKLIRYLFSFLTDNKITFHTPSKYFHFASEKFVFAYGIFNLILFFSFLRQNMNQRMINGILSITIFSISTITISYFESIGRLIECSACDDGKRVLFYNDINYDCIFLISLVFTLIPNIVFEIRNFRKS